MDHKIMLVELTGLTTFLISLKQLTWYNGEKASEDSVMVSGNST